MNKIFSSISNSFSTFLKDEEGAQVVEYALIIAVISIALVVALSALTTTAGNGFTAFITRVRTCLTSTVAGACA